MLKLFWRRYNIVLCLAHFLLSAGTQNKITIACGPPPPSTILEGWIYPGAPACSAATQLTQINAPILKPQYFATQNDGTIEVLTVGAPAFAGCNAYSPADLALVKQYSQLQFITVSASRAQMHALFTTTTTMAAGINVLVDNVVTWTVTGVEIDFEGFGSWTNTDYANYQLFLTNLGNALHAQGKQLMIDGPAIPDSSYQALFKFKYEDMNLLPVDYILSMVYDHQYDTGVGTPIAPFAWMTQCINWVKARVPNTNKIVIGMPSYGYHGPVDTYDITIDTYDQSSVLPGFNTATRDPASGEMTWDYITTNTFSAWFQDSTSMNMKKALIVSLGIRNISVWHLGGGNKWFTS